MDIVITFEKYIPKPNIFYGYFEVLKRMKFIADVKVVCDEKGKEPVIKVIRNTPTSVHGII